MKRRLEHSAAAFTRTELMVVIVIVLCVCWFLGSILLPLGMHRLRRRNERLMIPCISNFRQIGTGYRIWANDHNDRFPASESAAKGGWKDLLTNSDQGPNCWTNYAIMANELGFSPKLLACPTDERWELAWDSFTNGMPTNTFIENNSTLSYFVGVSANSSNPRSLLGGDRNLGAGTEPSPDYGFSPKDGKGNDVAIQTNSSLGPVSWSSKMHSTQHRAGVGNILLGDGSCQQVTSADFRKNCQPAAGETTNWPAGHVPSSPSFRVVFP